jgi:hypothetical protein
MSGPTVTWFALLSVALGSACRNVPTSVEQGAADDAVNESRAAADGPSSKATVGSMPARVAASAPPGSVSVITSTASTAPGAPAAPLGEPIVDAIASDEAGDGRAAPLQVGADELGSACRVWIDSEYSDVNEWDVAVRYVARADAGVDTRAQVEIPAVSPDACSPAPASVLPDAGTRSAAGTAAATQVDAGAPPLLVGAQIDLAREGWFLSAEASGVFLNVCANACFTIQARGGYLLLDARYAVRGASAR